MHTEEAVSLILKDDCFKSWQILIFANESLFKKI